MNSMETQPLKLVEAPSQTSDPRLPYVPPVVDTSKDGLIALLVSDPCAQDGVTGG